MSVVSHKIDDYAYKNYGSPEDVGEDPNAGQEEGLDGEWDSDSYAPADVTRDQILELFYKLDQKDRADETELLEILRDALKDEAAGDDAASAEAFAYVEGLLMEAEAGDTATDQETEEEAEASGTYQGSGEALTHHVKAGGDLLFAPQDPKDKVEVLDLNGNLIIKMQHKGVWERFILEATDISSIHIASDQVTGAIDQTGFPLTVGTEVQERYVPQRQKDEVARALRGAIDQIGYYTYTPKNKDGQRYVEMNKPEGKYIFGFDYDGLFGKTTNGIHYPDSKLVADNSDLGLEQLTRNNATTVGYVQEMLGLVADALETEDLTESRELWRTIGEKLNAWTTQSGGDVADDSAQLFFNILYTEVGAEKLGDFLKGGVLPDQFLNPFSDILKFSALESDLRVEIEGKQRGGPGWTHGTSADFIRNRTGIEEEEGSEEEAPETEPEADPEV